MGLLFTLLHAFCFCLQTPNAQVKYRILENSFSRFFDVGSDGQVVTQQQLSVSNLDRNNFNVSSDVPRKLAVPLLHGNQNLKLLLIVNQNVTLLFGLDVPDKSGIEDNSKISFLISQ